jgi:uncharacterized protein (UPF0332 family)
MPFVWRDYWVLANAVAIDQLPSGRLEAKRRTAISRAYYAAFHAAKAVVPWTELSGTGEDHRIVSEWLRNNGTDQGLVQAGRDLERLRVLRNRADYDAVFGSGRAEELREATEIALQWSEAIRAATAPAT